MKFRKKVFCSITTLAILIASIVFSAAMVSHPQQASAKEPAKRATTKTIEYPVTSGFDPWGNAIDKSGNVWVALPGCDPSPYCAANTPPGRFDVFNPTTSTWATGYPLPTDYAQPLFLAFDKLGQAWFAMPMDNSIGVFNPSNLSFQKWVVPTANAGPWDVAVDGNGMIWFTEHYANKIGKFNPTNHTFIEIPTPSSTSLPYGITVDASNNVWFTENNSAVALIAEYTAQGQLKEYKIRNTADGNLTPHLITVDTKGNIWWTEGFVGMIGKLTVARAVPGTNKGVKEYGYPQLCKGCGDHTSGIGIASNGLVWFDDSLQSSFGSFPMSGFGSFKMFTTPSPSSHPHDGLVVDKLHHVWIDEEFGNKLAKAN
ncbi:MAG: Vgb family protein [Ktedonobacteraceae bacterium]